MSSKQKTGDKLVASVRKSKTGAVARKTSERQSSGGSTVKAKTSTASPAASRASVSKKVGKKDSSGASYGYSLRGRVWPD